MKRIAPQVRMPGFRPGKVPANLVKKMHGEAIHADTLNQVVRAEFLRGRNFEYITAAP